MFNIAFPELLVIGVVALIVVGPEKLPRIARGAGLLLGRAQRQLNAIKSEISSELKTEDLQRLQDELRQHDLGLNDELRQGMQPVETVIQQSALSRAQAANQADQDEPEQETDRSVPAEPALAKRSLSE